MYLHKYFFIEPVVEMPVIQQVKVDDGIKEVPTPEPIPEPPQPERSPSPAEEVIEPEPLKYIEGVSKPYFHRNIKGINYGGMLKFLFYELSSKCNSVLMYYD